MNAMNVKDDVPSIPIENFTNQFLLVFDLSTMPDATEKCHHFELLGEPLRLEPNFIYPLKHITELILLGERMSSDAVD